MKKAKKPSGENIPEGFRNTDALKLRLHPAFAAKIREMSEQFEDDKLTMSHMVEIAFLNYCERLGESGLEELRAALAERTKAHVERQRTSKKPALQTQRKRLQNLERRVPQSSIATEDT